MEMIYTFCNAGQPPTKDDISDWVIATLRLRRTRNSLSGRGSIALSPAANAAIDSGGVSPHWFTGFYDRHPEVVVMEEASRPISMQRATAVHPGNRDLLFNSRMQILRDTGIMDAETGQVDTRRIFNCDECPQQVDGHPKGNNKPKVHGIGLITLC